MVIQSWERELNITAKVIEVDKSLVMDRLAAPGELTSAALKIEGLIRPMVLGTWTAQQGRSTRMRLVIELLPSTEIFLFLIGRINHSSADTSQRFEASEIGLVLVSKPHSECENEYLRVGMFVICGHEEHLWERDELDKKGSYVMGSGGSFKVDSEAYMFDETEGTKHERKAITIY